MVEERIRTEIIDCEHEDEETIEEILKTVMGKVYENNTIPCESNSFPLHMTSGRMPHGTVIMMIGITSKSGEFFIHTNDHIEAYHKIESFNLPDNILGDDETILNKV